jgi:sec-independent protein translocase protein TatA
MPWGLSPAHLIILLVIVLIVVGPGKLPDTGAAIGKALRGFKDAVETGDSPKNAAQQQALPPQQPPYPAQYPPQQPPYPAQPYPVMPVQPYAPQDVQPIPVAPAEQPAAPQAETPSKG